MTVNLRQYSQQPYELLCALDEALREVAGGEQGPGVAADDAARFWVGLGFNVGPYNLVCPRDDVREVINPMQTTWIPGAKDWLLGVANARGDLLPVIDLARLLGGEKTVIGPATRVIVLASQTVPAGFLVDAVFGFRQYAPADQRHDRAEEADEALQPHLLGGFVREGELRLAFSLLKLAHSKVFRQAGL